MYQVVRITSRDREVVSNNLTLSQANTLLNDIHCLERCTFNRFVSPIIELYTKDRMQSFVVDHGQNHYQYQVEEDRYSNLIDILKPTLN